jgi:hypothetical protein
MAEHHHRRYMFGGVPRGVVDQLDPVFTDNVSKKKARALCYFVESAVVSGVHQEKKQGTLY